MTTAPRSRAPRDIPGTFVDRRQFITTLPVVAAALTGTVSAQGVAFAAYHGASGASHQQQFDAADGLFKKGFRIRSLSVYRDASQTLYAGVWTNAPGPAWRAFHGLSSAGYQQYFDTWTAQGYRPVIISATGGGVIGNNQSSESVFAGVFEQDATPYLARHDANVQTFRDTCTWAKQNQHVLRWAALYGGRDRLYAGIWERTAANVTWDYRLVTIIDGPPAGVPLTMPGNDALKLSFVSRSPFGEYLTVYRSDQTGQLAAPPAMTSAQYQTQFDTFTGQGYMPTCVQAGGDPRVGPPVFVALFRKPTLLQELPRRELLQLPRP